MIELYSYKVPHTECPQCGATEAKISVAHLGGTFVATCAQCDIGEFGTTVGSSEKEALTLLDKAHDNFVLSLGQDEGDAYMEGSWFDESETCGTCEECSCEK